MNFVFVYLPSSKLISLTKWTVIYVKPSTLLQRALRFGQKNTQSHISISSLIDITNFKRPSANLHKHTQTHTAVHRPVGPGAAAWNGTLGTGKQSARDACYIPPGPLSHCFTPHTSLSQQLLLYSTATPPPRKPTHIRPH